MGYSGGKQSCTFNRLPVITSENYICVTKQTVNLEELPGKCQDITLKLQVVFIVCIYYLHIHNTTLVEQHKNN